MAVVRSVGRPAIPREDKWGLGSSETHTFMGLMGWARLSACKLPSLAGAVRGLGGPTEIGPSAHVSLLLFIYYFYLNLRFESLSCLQKSNI
jgi:hypothetical protein